MEKTAKKRMAALVGLALFSIAGLAQAAPETRFAVQDADSKDKMVITIDSVTKNASIGIGTATPTVPIQIKGPNVTGTQVMSQCTSGSDKATGGDPTCGGGFLGLRNGLAADGTTVTLPKAGERLGYMFFGSMFPDNIARNGAGLAGFAEADWTSGSIPAYFSFETAQPNGGSWSRLERMRISSIGNVGIGTKTPSQKLEVNGGLRLNTAAVKPTTCTAAQRGTVWMTQNSATGVADTLEVCMKNANGDFVWVQLN